jgi:hypothetical protein
MATTTNANGPFSGPLRSYAIELAAQMQKLPNAEFSVARIAMHGLFAEIDRLADAEPYMHVPGLPETHNERSEQR